MAGAINPREALLLLAAINHPWLVEAHAEELAALDFSLPELDSLAKRIIDSAASAPGLEQSALRSQLREEGYASILTRMERILSHGGDWFAQPDASPEDAEIGWLHTLARQRKAVVLSRELSAAEGELAREPGDRNAARLAGAREALEVFEGNEVTIEGYGRARTASDSARTLDDWIEINKHRLP
jgi:DNA primase